MPPYGLPQPTNSGSVDLSAIKPVSTGSVSIADALAKARNIAAEKGLQPYEGTSSAADPSQQGATSSFTNIFSLSQRPLARIPG